MFKLLPTYVLIGYASIILTNHTLLAQQLSLKSGDRYFSQDPVYVSDSGGEYSHRIYFQFRVNVLPSSNQSHIDVENLLSVKADGLPMLLRDLQAIYGPFEMHKAFPDAGWNDTHTINKRTGKSAPVPNLSQIGYFDFHHVVPIEEVVDRIETEPYIEYAEGPLQGFLTDSPDDWVYVNKTQWSLDKIGAEYAWDHAKGSGITIAIVDAWDSSVTEVHTDLNGRLVNDFGYYGGHGTWVSGVAGAVTNNGHGMASLGWDVSLEGYSMYNYSSIKDAADNGADVINNSWITTFNNNTLRNSVEYALAMGVVVVGGAGNEEICTSCVKYPAAYAFNIAGERHQVIAVSGTLANDNFRTGWTYSPGTDPLNDPTNAFIDVSAPGDSTLDVGDGIYVAYSYNDGTGRHSIVKRAGTSFAAPQVSALAGLLLSIDPTLTVPEVYDIITGSADKVGQYSYDANGWNRYLGYGRINAGIAVCSVAPTCSLSAPTNLQVVNYASTGQFPELAWTPPAGVVDHYNVYRQSPGSTSWVLVGTPDVSSYTDRDVRIAVKTGVNDYQYRVAAVDFGGVEGSYAWVSIWGEPSYKYGGPTLTDAKLPTRYELSQNYPNPFNPSTEIEFDLPESAFVRLIIYDVMGREVMRLIDQNMEAGRHSVIVDAEGLPSGAYLYRISVGSFRKSRSMMLLK